MEWVRWLGAGVVLLTAMLVAASVTASPPRSLPVPVVLEGGPGPETPPPTGAVVVAPSVVELGDPAPELSLGGMPDGQTDDGVGRDPDTDGDDDEDPASKTTTGKDEPDSDGADSDDEGEDAAEDPPGDDDYDEPND